MNRGLRRFQRHGAKTQDPELIQRVRKGVLDKLIDHELIEQESRKLTIEDVEEQVDQRLKTLEQKYGAGKRMEMYWKIRNHTLESAREYLRTRVRIDTYLKQQGILEPEIPEEQVRRLYESDPDSFSRKEESVRVSHVLIRLDEKAGPAARKEARKKAEQIRQEILEGKDFSEAARAYSDCHSAAKGGNLNYIKRGHMPTEFDDVAFALDKDALSEVVETSFGLHIIKVFERLPVGPIPLEEVRGFITKYLQEGESKKRLAAHIVELKSKAKIEMFLTE